MVRASDTLLGASPAPQRVTQAEYARIRGVSRETVSAAVKEGRISCSDGRIDPAVADSEWAARTDATRGRNAPTATAQAPTLAAGRARKMVADAEVAEMKAAEMRRDLVSVADARALWFAAGRTVRERMLALPDAMAGEMAWTPEQTARVRERVAQSLGDLPEEMPQ